MKSIYQLAGLNKDEVRILKLLEKETILATEISTKLAIPRATLDRIMTRLFNRGFVSKRKLGKRYLWISTPPDEILLRYGLVAKHSSTGVQIHQGRLAMLELTKKFVQSHAKERVRVLQTKQTWDFWSAYLTPVQISEVHTLLKKRAVINEGIFSEDLFSKKQKDFFQTYTTRPSIVHVLPEAYAQFATDITLTENVVYIMNWQEEIGIEINCQDIVRAFNHLFSFICDNTVVSNMYAHGKL